MSTANGTTMRFRPVHEVLDELGTLSKLILFADDNVMIHRKYSAELFTRMIPLQKHWIGQCSLAAVKRIENVKLMAESGCKALFIGFESIDEGTLQHTGKRQNRPSQYREVMDMLHDHGISTWGSFVFGFDTDDREVFDRTVEFGIDMKLTMALYAILTPYPATKLYRRLKEEKRLTNEKWWLRGDHDAGSPYFTPTGMSREELREGWQRAWQRFYSPRAIWDRWTVRKNSSWIQTLGYLPLNVMQNRLVKHKIVGGTQRFRSARDFDPMATAMSALASAETPNVDASQRTAGERSLLAGHGRLSSCPPAWSPSRLEPADLRPRRFTLDCSLFFETRSHAFSHRRRRPHRPERLAVLVAQRSRRRHQRHPQRGAVR